MSENNREEFSAEFEKFMERYLKRERELGLRKIHINVFNTLITLVLASLGLISALAWDDFLKRFFTSMLHGEETLAAALAYAVLVTIVTVVVTVILGSKDDSGNKES